MRATIAHRAFIALACSGIALGLALGLVTYAGKSFGDPFGFFAYLNDWLLDHSSPANGSAEVGPAPLLSFNESNVVIFWALLVCLSAVVGLAVALPQTGIQSQAQPRAAAIVFSLLSLLALGVSFPFLATVVRLAYG
jgi:hypothetical protein